MSEIDLAKSEMDSALERLRTIQTSEELKVVRAEVDSARDNLMRVSDEFRQSTQRNMEQMRTQSMAGIPQSGGMGMTKSVVPPGGVARPSISIDNDQVWACRRCGSKNVNWKKLGNRKRQRAYIKRYDVNKSLVVDGSVRYCILCSQELSRDQVLERISIKELRQINEDLMDKKAKST